MTPNPILAAIRAGKTVVAMWMELGSPDLAEAAVHRGWTALVVDNEHGVSSLDKAVELHRAARSAGGEVILRVPAADPVHLKLVMDRGFRCIMAPMINTADEAREFVAACRYPPRGRRGYAAPVVRASGYGANADYRRNSHEDILLIAQIEHHEAVDKIPEIAAVDGIDMLFIGPNDLAGSIGRLEELDHPDVLALAQTAEDAILASGKWLGSIPRPGRTAADLHTRGCRLIVGPSDIGFFLSGASATHADYPFKA
ncbi:MAG: aldolase/citrate lyase family protein [Pseudomonadota bacterium]